MQLIPIRDKPQRQQMLELLAEGFPGIAIDWAGGFKAPAGDSGHGWLMLIDQQLAGGILTFEATMPIRGIPRRFVNMSSWYIRPPYRRYAVRMVREICSDPAAIYTACSPIPSVRKIMQRIGYRYVSEGSIASVPLLNGMTSETGITVEPFAPGKLANPEHDKWMAAHGDERHVGILIRQGSNVTPALWIGGFKVRRLPAARLLFAGDHHLLRAALPRVHWHMMRYHGVACFYLPRIAPYAGVRSFRNSTSGPWIGIKGDITDEEVNLLYSELLYLH